MFQSMVYWIFSMILPLVGSFYIASLMVSRQSLFQVIVLSRFKPCWLSFITGTKQSYHITMNYVDGEETLQWRHNERDGVPNHQLLADCWLNRLFRRRSKKTSKFRVTGLCEVNADNTSTWWRHHRKTITMGAFTYARKHSKLISLLGTFQQ